MFATFNDPMNSTGHLRGDCGIRVAAQIGVVTVFDDIAFELVMEAIRLLEDGNLSGHPEGATQRCQATGVRRSQRRNAYA